jgi:limonene-1,2-epoxide hydrolase
MIWKRKSIMNKLLVVSSLLLTLSAFVACSSGTTPSPTGVTTTDAVKILQAYFQALTEGDIDKAMSFVADDAVFIDPMGKYVGEENIRAVYAPQMNKGGRWEPSDINDVNGKGKLIYNFTAYIDDTIVFSGKGLTVVKDGKIIFDGGGASWIRECEREPSQSFCGD